MLFNLNLILTYLSPAISFLLIAGLLLSQIFKKRLPSLKTLNILIKIFISFLIIFAIFLSVLNYFAWKQNDVSKNLLPPFASITYILHYSWQHYLFEPIVTILFALIIFKIIALLNKKFNNTFFYNEEPYLAALGILATGWPNCLIFLCLVLFLGVLIHFLFRFKDFACLLKRSYRSIFSSFIQGEARDIFFRNHPQPSGHGVAEGDERGEDLRERACRASERVEENISRASFRLSLLYFWLPCALLVLLLSGIISKYLIINQFII